MRPICIKCQRFFKCIKNDYWFTEGAPELVQSGDSAKPGSAEPEKWYPYRIWAGDLYECPGCKAQIISGIAQIPLRMSHNPDFEIVRQEIGATQFQVNDC